VSRSLLFLLPLAIACGQTPPEPAQPAGHDHDHEHEHDHAGPDHQHAHDHGHDGHDHAGHDHAHGGGDHHAMDHGHSFADVEKWAAIFDSPERDAWQKPAELVAALEIAPGSTVADIGAGTGYFQPHLAQAVGAEGKVIALDSEPAMVEHMKARFSQEGAPAVDVRLSTATETKLAEAEADLLLLVNTYHHITERGAYFSALAGNLKPEGRLVIVDYKPEATPNGPPPAMRIAPETIKAELEGAGWVQQKTLDLLPEQYVLVFDAKPAEAAPAEAAPAVE
jgi:ubiquinone/menaquinone biosynthesis C-methylase UbiE